MALLEARVHPQREQNQQPRQASIVCCQYAGKRPCLILSLGVERRKGGKSRSSYVFLIGSKERKINQIVSISPLELLSSGISQQPGATPCQRLGDFEPFVTPEPQPLP